MPVHVEEIVSDVSVVAGDLPLTPQQIDKLVALVLRKLQDQQRDAARRANATKMRTRVSDHPRATE